MATATRGFKVCWRPSDTGDNYAQQRFRDAFGPRLTGAGYVLVPTGCELQLSWTLETERVRGPGWFKNATLVVRSASGAFVDKLSLDFMQDQAPAEEPDRVARP
jgi:hypothetical protein